MAGGFGGFCAVALAGVLLCGAAADGPKIEVWYGLDQQFGSPGLPGRFVNILGRISPAKDIASAEYSLNGGPPVRLKLGPDTRRLSKAGDFNVDLETSTLKPGENTVAITARNRAGSLFTCSPGDVDLALASGTSVPPQGFRAETRGRSPCYAQMKRRYGYPFFNGNVFNGDGNLGAGTTHRNPELQDTVQRFIKAVDTGDVATVRTTYSPEFLNVRVAEDGGFVRLNGDQILGILKSAGAGHSIPTKDTVIHHAEVSATWGSC